MNLSHVTLCVDLQAHQCVSRIVDKCADPNSLIDLDQLFNFPLEERLGKDHTKAVNLFRKLQEEVWSSVIIS
mgnify:CR=1 FL=1